MKVRNRIKEMNYIKFTLALGLLANLIRSGMYCQIVYIFKSESDYSLVIFVILADVIVGNQ